MKSGIFFVGITLLLCGCATTAPPPVRSVPIPAAPQTGEPADLIGLDGAGIRALFGAPAFMRHDGVAEMWRYDGAACHGFFFFYPNGGKKTVRHVETLPAGATRAADDKCLTALRLSLPAS